jgi:hypothetical protein
MGISWSRDPHGSQHHQKCSFVILRTLAQHLDVYIASTLPLKPKQQVEQMVEQRVMDIATQEHSPGIQRVSNATVAQLANKPISTRLLQTKILTHQSTTQVNTPEVLLKIKMVNIIEPMPAVPSTPPTSA